MVDDWKDHFLNPTITAKRVERKSEKQGEWLGNVAGVDPLGVSSATRGPPGPDTPADWWRMGFGLLCSTALLCRICKIALENGFSLLCSAALLESVFLFRFRFRSIYSTVEQKDLLQKQKIEIKILKALRPLDCAVWFKIQHKFVKINLVELKITPYITYVWQYCIVAE